MEYQHAVWYDTTPIQLYNHYFKFQEMEHIMYFWQSLRWQANFYVLWISFVDEYLFWRWWLAADASSICVFIFHFDPSRILPPKNFVCIVTAHHTFALKKCVLFLLQHITHFQNGFNQTSFVCWIKLVVRLLRGFLNCWALSAGETTAEPLKGQLFSAMFLVSSNWDHF